MTRIVFFGSGAFAIPSLQAVQSLANCEVVQVVTQPPKPKGRSHSVTPTPIQTFAEQAGIPYCVDYQELRDADLAVVVYFGRIIPEKVLKRFALGCVNLHPSLLPRWRGPSPIISALLAGDKATGVTVMKLDNGVDTGPILYQEPEQILSTDTNISLEQRLALHGADCLKHSLPLYLAGKITPQAQPKEGVTTSQFITRETGQITADMTKEAIITRWRALQPWPGVFYMWGNKRLKLIDFDLTGAQASLRTVQLEGKRPQALADFLRGHADWPLPQLL